VKNRHLLNFIATLIGMFSLIVLSCSEDSSPTGGGGGGGDKTPPGITSVTAIDDRHIEVEFDENVTKETSERPRSYVIVEQTPSPFLGSSAPGDTIGVSSAALGTDGKTVTLTTQVPMSNVPYDCSVSGVEDANGNAIVGSASAGFTGSNTADQTPPVIVFRSPAPNETGVGTGESVVVQFSEGMDYGSVQGAFSWTGPGGDVPFQAQQEGGNNYVFTPLQALMNSTTYNIGISGSAMDWAGNNLVASNWSFTTTATVDTKKPSLVSTSPANGATNVSVATNITLTFSEAMNPFSAMEIIVTPEINDGVVTWTNNGSKLNFDPDVDLTDNTQYTLILPAGGLTDLAGNGLDKSYQIVFSTGSTLLPGSIEGTIGGDPLSATASDPEGAIVVASAAPPDNDGEILGSGLVDNNGDYDINNLPDGWYYPFAILDSNNDGKIDPSTGDAVGAYGVDFTGGGGEFDSVEVVGGNTVKNVDFDLYDPVAILGLAIYTDTAYNGGNYPIYVQAFDTTGFDPLSPQPDFEADASYPDRPDYRFGELDGNLAPGTYYIGAYMDVNFN